MKERDKKEKDERRYKKFSAFKRREKSVFVRARETKSDKQKQNLF
jgi:hypothetical protein